MYPHLLAAICVFSLLSIPRLGKQTGQSSGHAWQGYWGNPMCAYAKDRNVPWLSENAQDVLPFYFVFL